MYFKALGIRIFAHKGAVLRKALTFLWDCAKIIKKHKETAYGSDED